MDMDVSVILGSFRETPNMIRSLVSAPGPLGSELHRPRFLMTQSLTRVVHKHEKGLPPTEASPDMRLDILQID